MQVNGFASHGGVKRVYLLQKMFLKFFQVIIFLPLEEFHRLMKSFLKG